MQLILGLLGLGAAAAIAGFEGLYRRRDLGHVVMQGAQRTPWQELPASAPHLRQFVCQVPFHNQSGAYEQTLVDVTASVRVLAKDPVQPGEIKAVASVRCLNADGRNDGYWAATLFSPRETTPMELTVRIEADPAIRLHAAVVSIRYVTYGRGPYKPVEDEVVLPLSAVKPLPAPIQGETVSIQCVPTPILTDIDNIVDVIDQWTRAFRQPGDLVAVAESVVAITQHQYFRPQDVRPGFWASRLCYFIPSKGSLSSRHGFQVAMNQVGAAKMIAALFAGFLGKLVGKNGVFYELAGRPAELIDDVTGTMPPFDKYIVAGPRDPEGVVAEIKARTGMEAAIVDANDLKRAMVLACTDGVKAEEVSRMLLDNPFGNAAEQTPIVVLRRRAASPQPSGVGSDQRDSIRSV
jgi:hypothetical protein